MKLRRPHPGCPRGKVELHATHRTEAINERLGESPRITRLADRIGKNCPGLSLHRPAMPGSPDTQPFLHPLIKIPDTHRRQPNHHLWLLSMLATHPRWRTRTRSAPTSTGSTMADPAHQSEGRRVVLAHHVGGRDRPPHRRS